MLRRVFRRIDGAQPDLNLLPFDFLMMGESYHNHHHKFGGQPNFGIRWHEFDPASPLLRVLNALHIIKLRFSRDEAYM